MGTIFKTAIACGIALTMSALPAAARWQQACDGPAYVCGSSAGDHWPKKSKAAARTKKKTHGGGSYVYSGGGGQSGIASWYGGKFHGRKTASGERYNQNGMTAAHKTLPFGTRVQVTNTRTGNSVIVRINDRGPFVKGRVIDLSRAAAGQLGVNGLAPVRLTVLGRG